MRYKSLKIEDKEITNPNKINDILVDNGLDWLIDCEIEDAEIEIKNKTLIWMSGKLYSGTWWYGIWKKGEFWGIWENGIFEGGKFGGTFKSGIKSSKL